MPTTCEDCDGEGFFELDPRYDGDPDAGRKIPCWSCSHD